jgi:hypothetical protein
VLRWDEKGLWVLEKVGMRLMRASSPAVAKMFPVLEKAEDVMVWECSRKCKTISGSDIVY